MRFDDLCLDLAPVLEDLCSFLGLSLRVVDLPALSARVHPPASMNRYLGSPIADTFALGEIDAVRRFGFDVPASLPRRLG